MGIKFNCPACGRPLNVKSELAGKRGRCPKCQAKITIPAESAADSSGSQADDASGFAATVATVVPVAGSDVSAPVAPAAGAGFVAVEDQPTVSLAAKPAGAPTAVVDPISEAPQMQWYAMPPGAANQYGPAKGEEFRVWMQEGRVTADALVWRQDWPDWKRAGSVFPQLEAAAPVASLVAAPVASMPLPTAAAAMPMTAGSPPMAQPAFPMAAPTPGMFPSGPIVMPAADGFPVTPTEPTRTRGAAARGYRPRSNTGPMIAIVVLLLAMVPLSYFVWKVVSEQLGSAPVKPGAASSKQPEE